MEAPNPLPTLRRREAVAVEIPTILAAMVVETVEALDEDRRVVVAVAAVAAEISFKVCSAKFVARKDTWRIAAIRDSTVTSLGHRKRLLPQRQLHTGLIQIGTWTLEPRTISLEILRSSGCVRNTTEVIKSTRQMA